LFLSTTDVRMPIVPLRTFVWLLRVAFVCWALPFALGLLDFTWWYLTRAEWLTTAGAVIVSVGIVLLGIGTAALVAYGLLVKKPRPPGWGVRTATLSALLVSNLPLAVGLVFFAERLITLNSVIVDNQSMRAVESVDLLAPDGERFSLGPVRPRTRVVRTFHFRGEGEVRYLMRLKGQVDQGGVAFRGVSNGLDGITSLLNVGADTRVRVTERPSH